MTTCRGQAVARGRQGQEGQVLSRPTVLDATTILRGECVAGSSEVTGQGGRYLRQFIVIRLIYLFLFFYLVLCYYYYY